MAEEQHDNLRDQVGQAIADEIHAGVPAPDWFDSREIDRLADAVLKLPAIARFQSDADRLEKLLSMVTDCKVKFGAGNKARQLTLIIKNSVQTSANYRAEMRKLIDEIEPTWKA